MVIFRAFILTFFLFCAPCIIGMSWTKILPNKKVCRLLACFPIGLFVELAIFQLIVAPMSFLHQPFTRMCWVFGGTVLIYSAWAGYQSVMKPPFSIRIPHLSRFEVLYLLVFLCLLGIQLFNSFSRDTTIWSYDDATYVTYAADAMRVNSIQTINPDTGIAQSFNAFRAMQTSLYFPAFLSVISSIPVTVMERTILETYNIALAYVVYAYMASVIYKKIEERLIFLIVLCVIYIYGLYSQYSVTFRLLGPNYQGKAVLAVSFFPFLLTMFVQMLERKYSNRFGALCLLLSATATSFTMFGAAMMIFNTSLVTILSVFRKERQWNHLRYIPWSACLPILYLGVYFVYMCAIV